MPADEYSSFGGGGALKLKGGKVTKHKKKKKDRSGAGSDLEKSLSTGETQSKSDEKRKEKKSREPGTDVERDEGKRDDGDEAKLVEYKTEAERRHEEFQRKKVSRHPQWRRGCYSRNKKEILTTLVQTHSCSSYPNPRARARSSSRRTRKGSKS